MSKINDGGPAFPVPGLMHDETFNGLSMRDYFAAKALQGLLADPDTKGSFREYAKDAYAYADEMLLNREET
jgi:hypothetical protein